MRVSPLSVPRPQETYEAIMASFLPPEVQSHGSSQDSPCSFSMAGWVQGSLFPSPVVSYSFIFQLKRLRFKDSEVPNNIDDNALLYKCLLIAH